MNIQIFKVNKMQINEFQGTKTIRLDEDILRLVCPKSQGCFTKD